jgi:hypothetical protein
MRQSLLSLVSGTLFGAGLAVSGMADPQRVRGFLDLFGAWDPTLAFVMGGALIPMAIAWRIQRRMPSPMAAERFTLPTVRDLDPRLIGGAALVGIGWGVAGLCPGPALASLALAPAAVRRATAAHEVAHRIHMDHSPAFHALVEQLYGSDPTPHRRWLRTHGATLHWYGRSSTGGGAG